MNALKRPALLSVLGLIGLRTHMKVTELNPVTGRFPTRQEATVVTSVHIDLDEFSARLLMPDNEFVRAQVHHIGYFDETLAVEQLEDAVLKNGLTDQVSSVLDNAGIQQAYHAYRHFLWLQFKTREEAGKVFAQFVLIKPDDMQELFLVERELDYPVAGVDDQNTWYPLFNALVGYIDANSKTWSAKKKVRNASREPMHSPVSDLSLLPR